MGLSLAAGLAGFSRRGMTFNDEQRKFLNDNIQNAINIGVADAMEQRKARKALSTSYIDTATKLKSYQLNDAQIEAVYGRYGNSAPEEIAAALKDAAAQHELKNKRAGIESPWGVANEREWLQSRFSLPQGVTPDMVQGRSAQEQARAFTDVNLPLTMMNPQEAAKALAAGSGEISIRGGRAREQAIANQMAGLMQSATGGMQESGPASFGNQYTFSLGPTSADVNEAALAAAQLETAQATATSATADASVSDEMAQEKLIAIRLGNSTSQFNLEAAREAHPKKMQQLDAQIENLGYKNITDLANSNAAQAMASLNIATAEAGLQGKLVANTIASITASNEEERQRTSLDIAKSQFTGQELSNALNELKLEFQPELLRGALKKLQLGNDILVSEDTIKAAEAGSAEALQQINVAMQGVLLETNKLRKDLVTEQITAAINSNAMQPLREEELQARITAAQNKNSLFGLEQQQLEATIANIETRTSNVGKATTYQAALVEISGAISDLDQQLAMGQIEEDVYNQKIISLTSSQSRLTTGLLAYTASTDKTKTTTPISYTQLVNGYSKGLAAKLSAAGIKQGTGGRNYQLSDTGTIIYDRAQIGQAGMEVVRQHNAEYRDMLAGQTFGTEAMATLFGDQQAASEFDNIPLVVINDEGQATVPAGVAVGDRVKAADGEIRIYNGPDADPMFSPVGE